MLPATLSLPHSIDFLPQILAETAKHSTWQLTSDTDCVLYFFPEPDTFVCNAQNDKFSELFEEFQKLGVEVVGVSPVEATVLNEYKKKHNYPQTFLPDPNYRLHNMFNLSFPIVRKSFCISQGFIIDQFINPILGASHAENSLKAFQKHFSDGF